MIVRTQCAAAEVAVAVGGAWALLNVPDQPKASLILVPGGDGVMGIEANGTFRALSGNQLVRTRKHYLAYDMATMTVDKSVDLTEAIAFMRRIASPVAVAVSSRGSLRVPRILPGKPDALVLTSSFLDLLREALMDPLRLPRTLIVHHRHDGCWATPPNGVHRFREWGRENVTVKWIEGGVEEGDPCQARSGHGFNGRDDEVVRVIASYIRNP